MSFQRFTNICLSRVRVFCIRHSFAPVWLSETERVPLSLPCYLGHSLAQCCVLTRAMILNCTLSWVLLD